MNYKSSDWLDKIKPGNIVAWRYSRVNIHKWERIAKRFFLKKGMSVLFKEATPGMPTMHQGTDPKYS